MVTEQSDSLLLREFAVGRSQEAFATLVSRHSDWVYWAAVRMVRDPHLAEDVVQAVFLILADKAGKLAGVPLHRWLFKVTRYASSNAIRSRTRRERHERQAAMARSEIDQPDADRMWQEISPVLDDSLSRLRSKDRDAVLLRFYQQKEMAEVAAALGVSEGAAKVRIVRALEKLRRILRRRGITVPAADLSAVLLLHITRPAPVHFAGVQLAGAASPQSAAIARGVSTMMTAAKVKIAVAMILLLGIPVGAGAFLMMDSPFRAVADREQPAPQSVAVDQAPLADTGTDLDPRIAPFVTNRTDMILAVDITKIDLDAVAADIRKELNQMPMDPASAAHVNGEIQMGLNFGKQWIAGFAASGGTTMFVAIGADQLNGPSAAVHNLNFRHPTVVFPADSPEAAQRLRQFLTATAGGPMTIVGNSVVVNPPAWEPSFGPDARPALAEA